ncbi:PaaI family thioesterase [Rhodococcus sp. IEGM 1366]|uniref:PaaI family thioesterase n=1 Tax=Rhodococcus sp. IEGM 1366 TaxID=3082223 RepID=UPI0029547C57|nr:PaaI family thioesterase [Rhodococcus sp. IEGM 1366]MDV8071255.1 PaaI family thioesterase [Rhodococcus sp. IEGM 1366]
MTTGYGAAAVSTEDGWTEVIDDGFIALVGPFHTRTDGGQTEVAVVCQDKHCNRRGIVQGGLVMTFDDRALGIAARAHGGAPPRQQCTSTCTSSLPSTSATSCAADPTPHPGPGRCSFMR